MLEFLQKNITTIKYGLIVVNMFFMIIAIRAVVNYQNIITSIETVQNDIEDRQNHTYYINNFVTPYLQSEYAPYFFAHENNQVFPGETLIKITTLASGSDTNTVINPSLTSKVHTNPSAQDSWNNYIQSLTETIQFRK